jgi:acyl transferase domain-containing protein
MHGLGGTNTHVVLQEPNRLGHETGTDQEKETSRDDQEPVQGKGRTGSVD